MVRVEKKTKLATMMTAMRIMTTYFYDDDIHKNANRRRKNGGYFYSELLSADSRE